MTGHTIPTSEPWTEAAEEHINRTDPYEIDPEAIADKVIEAVSETPSRDTIEAYVRDRI